MKKDDGHIKATIVAKVNEIVHRLQREQGLETLSAIEQELQTAQEKPVDVAALKAEIQKDAFKRFLLAKNDSERLAAQQILEALRHAQNAEHLFNIDVYDKMHGKLEHRGSPALDEAGYYDDHGIIEFRMVPQASPQKTIEVYDELVKTIFSSAKKFGLSADLLNEQLNMSVWKDGKNLTSIPEGPDKVISGRILMGMLDTAEDVWPLRPHRVERLKLRNMYDVPIHAGPDAKLSGTIRVVNYDDKTSAHHYEQCGDYMGGINNSVPYRMLMMLDGVERGVNNPAYDKDIKPIKASCLVSIASTNSPLEFTFLKLLCHSCQLDEQGHVKNMDALFHRRLNGKDMAGVFAEELAGGSTEADQQRTLAFLKALKITPTGIEFPRDVEFRDMVERVSAVPIKHMKIYDSICYEGIRIPNQQVEEQRAKALRERWGNDIVDAIIHTTEKMKQPEEAKPKHWLDFIHSKKNVPWSQYK